MYQLNEFDLWHQRHHELLREAENNRLARRLGEERLQGSSRRGNGRRMMTTSLRRAIALGWRPLSRSLRLRASRTE